MTRFCNFILTLTLVCGTLSLASVQSALATSAPPASASCDVEYRDTLNSKALLEAERRMRQAQNLIIKPDSVFAYTCFDILTNYAAMHNERIFSEEYGGHCFHAALDCAFLDLVQPFLSYWLTNPNSPFSHNFIGGRGSAQTFPNSGQVMCDVMARVWQEAKCRSFAVEHEDGFFNLAAYENMDPRVFPAGMECTMNNPSFWADNLEIVYETGEGNILQTMRSRIGAQVNHVSARTDPVEASGSCGALVQSGVTLTDSFGLIFRGQTFTGGFCTNPGCRKVGNRCVPRM